MARSDKSGSLSQVAVILLNVLQLCLYLECILHGKWKRAVHVSKLIQSDEEGEIVGSDHHTAIYSSPPYIH